MPTTCLCSRPAGDGYLCKPCTGTLERALAETPFLIRELDIVITRQTVHAARSDGSRSTGIPLPFHVAASDTRRRLATALDFTAATLIRTGHANSCPVSPRPHHTSVWLLAQLDTIRHHAQAQEFHNLILEPVAKARWLIDRPADRWYAGPCNNLVHREAPEPVGTEIYECGAELYATAGAAEVKCRSCAAVYDVQARRDWLLAAAEDHLANAAVCARAVSWLGGAKLTPTLIRVWHARGRLMAKAHEPYPSGTDPDRTRPLYRVGDVIDLLAQQTQKETG